MERQDIDAKLVFLAQSMRAKLLTTANPAAQADRNLFEKLGLAPMPARD